MAKPYRFVKVSELGKHGHYGLEMFSLYNLEGVKFIGFGKINPDDTVDADVVDPSTTPLFMMKAKVYGRQGYYILTDGETYYNTKGIKHLVIDTANRKPLSEIDQMLIKEEIRLYFLKFA